MSLAWQQELADCLEKEVETLCTQILSQINEDLDGPVRPIVVDWLNAKIVLLRGGADRLNEWVVQLADLVREPGGGLVRGLEILSQCHKSLCALVALQPAVVCEPASAEFLLAQMDRYVTAFAGHYVQETRGRLTAERRRVRAVAESVNGPFLMLDSEGNIEFANGAFADETGVPLATLAGQSFYRYCSDNAAAQVKRILRQRGPGNERSIGGELLVNRGQALRVRFNVAAVFDDGGRRDGAAVCITGEETSPRAELLGRIAETLVDVTPVGIQVYDQEAQLLHTNGACASHIAEVGLDTGSWGRQLWIPARDACLVDVVGQVLSTGQFFAGEARLPGEPADLFQVHLAPAPNEYGQVSYVLCLYFDMMTGAGFDPSLERKLLQHQQESLVSQVAITVAHQLRNPLGVVVGFAGMLAQGLPPEQVPGAVDKMLRNGIRCKEIVEDLLKFGQGLPGERAQVELRDLIDQSVKPYLPASDHGRIEWLLPDAPCTIECVPSQLGQVLVHLLANALQAAQRRVRLEARVREERLHVICSDDGPGVDSALHHRVFEPFFTTRKERKAVGLGLSLSQSVLREYGGRLRLLEKPSDLGGACFVAEIPLAGAPAEAAPGEPEAPHAPKPHRRILVVDDEVDLLEMLAMVLEMHGYEVETASTGVDALEKVRHAQFDAAVLDVQLPGSLSGPQCYEYWLGTNPELAERTLFITADTMRYETRRFLARVKRPSMEKPFLVEDFTKAVEELFASSDGAPSAAPK